MQFSSLLDFFLVCHVYFGIHCNQVFVLFCFVCTIISDDAFGAAYRFSAKVIMPAFVTGDLTLART